MRPSIKRAHGWMHTLLDRSAIISALQHAMQLKQVSFKTSLYDLSVNLTHAREILRRHNYYTKFANQVYYSVGSEFSVLTLCEIISRITCRKAINRVEVTTVVVGPTSKIKTRPVNVI